jgi:hypothetical protein|tara:strand:+ start:648 stop:875 length:228 start_codon:yes stop_codon:yes gene_type:complete
MKIIIIIFLFFIISNCSLNKDSQYWNENSIESVRNDKKITEIIKKADDITSMTFHEYKIYIDEHTKKSKYPNINK